MTDSINEEELLPREESESSSGACPCFTPPGAGAEEDCDYWCPGDCNVARTAHCGDDCTQPFKSAYCDAECTKPISEFCDGAGCQEPMKDYCCGECNDEGQCAPATKREDLCNPEECGSTLQSELCCDEGCDCGQKRYYCDPECTDSIGNYCNNDCVTEPCDDGSCPSIYCGVCPEDADANSSDGKRRSELCPTNCTGLPLDAGQVCCEGEPVASDDCCDGTKVPDDGSVCCDNQIVSSDKCCAGKVIPDGSQCCGEGDNAVIATECCEGKVLTDDQQCCGGGIYPNTESCCGDAGDGEILQDGETCCSGKISHGECCGPGDNPVGKDQRCCEDTVVPNSTGCCDDKISFYPYCCPVGGVNNVIGEGETCCNGVGVYNDSTHICCETDGVIKPITETCDYDDSCCGGNCDFGATVEACNTQMDNPDIGGCGCASDGRNCKTNAECNGPASTISDPHITTFFGEKYAL